MAKIVRKLQKIFASAASNNGQFGSLQAGTKVLSNDLAVIQALSAFLTGWNSATAGSQHVPSTEEMQGLQYMMTTQLAYIFQEGVPEYEVGTTYFINSIVKKAGTYQLWGSKVDNNTGNALAAGANWQLLCDLANPTTIITWGGTAGGTANALTLTPTTALTAYAAGQMIAFLPASDNTSGTVTINISGLGALNVTKGGTTLLAPRDLKSGKLAFGIYDGTQIQLINHQIFGHGADIAAAATLNLDAATGVIIDVTGNTGITAITLAEGAMRIVRFTGTPVITNGASLVLPGGANITAAAGDYAIIMGYASGVVRLLYFRANGTAVVAPTVPVPYSAIAGWTPNTITGSNATNNALNVTAGQCADSTNTSLITGVGYTWASGFGNVVNGYVGGATLPNNTTIHFFAISNAAGTLTGTWGDTSLTPSLPSGYTKYRRIFSLMTNASGVLIPINAIEAEGGALINWFTVSGFLDVNGATASSANRTLYALTVPLGIKVQAYIRGDAGGGNHVVTSPDEADLAVSGTFPFSAVPGFDLNASAGSQITVTTDTSGRIGNRSGGANTFSIVTRGWKDFRR